MIEGNLVSRCLKVSDRLVQPRLSLFCLKSAPSPRNLPLKSTPRYSRKGSSRERSGCVTSPTLQLGQEPSHILVRHFCDWTRCYSQLRIPLALQRVMLRGVVDGATTRQIESAGTWLSSYLSQCEAYKKKASASGCRSVMKLGRLGRSNRRELRHSWSKEEGRRARNRGARGLGKGGAQYQAPSTMHRLCWVVGIV